MDEVKKHLDDLSAGWEEFKTAHATEKDEIKRLGEATAETKAVIEKLAVRLDESEVATRKALEERQGNGADEKKADAVAFLDWCRKGDNAAAETKAQLQIGDDSAGGFLAPADFSREIVKGIVEYSEVRSYARVMRTTATSVKIPKRTGVFAATWTASAATRSETTGLTYGQDEIPTHELYALVDIENQLLEDSEFDLEAELLMEFSEQFGVAEGEALINGTGLGRPEGVLATGAGVDETHTATNDVFVANDLISTYYDVKTGYAKNGTWAFNRGIMKAIRKMQDSVGNYLWNPGLAGLAPATVLDRPYFECPELADAVADNAKIAIFGDWRKGLRVVDRVQTTVQRDPYTQNTVGATRFIARKRVGGQVVLPEALRVLDVT